MSLACRRNSYLWQHSRCQITAPRWPIDISFAADNAIFKNRAPNIECSFGCVARSAVLLKPNVGNILLFNFCEQKFIQHGPITIVLDCNGVCNGVCNGESVKTRLRIGAFQFLYFSCFLSIFSSVNVKSVYILSFHSILFFRPAVSKYPILYFKASFKVYFLVIFLFAICLTKTFVYDSLCNSTIFAEP